MKKSLKGVLVTDDVCGDQTVVFYGAVIGNVGSQSDLSCQRYPGHDGMHKVKRWFGNVLMTAEWD